MEYASKGVAGAGLGLGIAGTVFGVTILECVVKPPIALRRLITLKHIKVVTIVDQIRLKILVECIFVPKPFGPDGLMLFKHLINMCVIKQQSASKRDVHVSEFGFEGVTDILPKNGRLAIKDN